MVFKVIVISVVLWASCSAFLSTRIRSHRLYHQHLHDTAGANNGDKTPLDGLRDNLATGWRIFQESSEDNFKQRVANVLAGEYDREAAKAQIETTIGNDPLVLFTWEPSPSCKQALEALKVAGVPDSKIKNVRLDDPWSEGNPIRAELGKMVGRPSVPCIFIEGQYVGGFDGGVGGEAPGIQAMAFQGTLRPLLEKAGVL